MEVLPLIGNVIQYKSKNGNQLKAQKLLKIKDITNIYLL
jgi:hypothetical protein